MEMFSARLPEPEALGCLAPLWDWGLGLGWRSPSAASLGLAGPVTFSPSQGSPSVSWGGL